MFSVVIDGLWYKNCPVLLSSFLVQNSTHSEKQLVLLAQRRQKLHIKLQQLHSRTRVHGYTQKVPEHIQKETHDKVNHYRGGLKKKSSQLQQNCSDLLRFARFCGSLISDCSSGAGSEEPRHPAFSSGSCREELGLTERLLCPLCPPCRFD